MSTIFLDLLIALGLGLLVGLQKERAASPLAGLKTFAIVSVFGAAAAIVGAESGPWVIIAGLVSVTVLMVIGNVIHMRLGGARPGQTTEMAVVLMYLIGAITVVAPRELGIVLGGGLAVLLHMRERLKSVVSKLSDRDVRAIMQFVLLALVVFPVLPNRTFGPFEVLNPRQIWLMVVLIVGINLVGYAAFRFMGRRTGTAVAGFLGGAVSSTATTIAYARATRVEPSSGPVAAAVVWIASGMVFVRVLLEMGVVAPTLLRTALAPFGLMLALFLAAATLVWPAAARTEERAEKGKGAGADENGGTEGAEERSEGPHEPQNPTELRPAIGFAFLYAGILLLVAAAESSFGTPGLYAAAALAGLTDIDAITLSTSQLVATERMGAETAWRIILLASLANLAFKLGIVSVLGGRALTARLAGPFALAVAAGGALLLFWR